MEKKKFSGNINVLKACKENILKRGLSVLIAGATFCTAIAFAMPTTVDAATYYVNFVNNVTKQKERDTMLLEGETVNIDKNMPAGYNFQPGNPYKIIGEPNIASIIKTTDDGSITAVEGASGATGSKIYTVRPVFSAFLTKSDTGKATCFTQNIDDPTSPIEKTVNLSAEILNVRDLSITETSSISFTVKDDQTEPDGQIEFNKVVATNDLEDDFNGVDVTYVERRDGKLIVKISNSTTGTNIDIALTCSLPSLLLKNSKFEFTFAMQTVADMQLTIVSAQYAVDTIASNISASANFDKFVQLAAGDARDNITTRFQLLHTEKRYNNERGFNIDWEWIPDDPMAHSNVLLIDKSNPTAIKWLATPKPVLEDMPGKLKATVSYVPTTGITPPLNKSATPVNVRLIGTGRMPSFYPRTAIIGEQDADGKQKLVTKNINGEFPTKMDVNDGSYNGFPATLPFEFNADLRYGMGLRRASYIVIEAAQGANGQVAMFIDGSQEKYVFGTKLELPEVISGEAERIVTVRAISPGLAQFKITYYTSKGEEFSAKSYNIDITDTSPNKDASFKDIIITGKPVTEAWIDDPNNPGNLIDIGDEYEERFNKLFGTSGIITEPFYTFDPKTSVYKIILPWAVETVTLTPKYNSRNANNAFVSWKSSTVSDNQTVDGYGDATRPITLAEGDTMKFNIAGTAEDKETMSTYSIEIHRQPRSDVASLTALSVTTLSDNKVHEVTPKFDSNTYKYRLELPYAFRSRADEPAVNISATSYGDWGIKPQFSGITVAPDFLQRVAGIFGGNTHENKAKLLYDVAADGTINNSNRITITAFSEDGKKKAAYDLDIVILDPSRNTQLADMKVYEKDGETVIPFAGGAAFTKKGRDYYVQIPYKTDAAWFELLPDDEKAQKITTTHPSIYNAGSTDHIYKVKGEPIRFKVNIPYQSANHSQSMNFTYEFNVQAESDQWTNEDGGETYKVHFERLPANTDARLKSLTVVNIEDSKPVENFQFIQSKLDYSFTVPYTTEEVLVTPVATQPVLSEVTVNGTKITDTRLNKNIPLAAGKSNKVEIIIIPESGTKDRMVYTLNITREAPSTEARLQKLTVGGGEKMLPEPFVPSTLNYTVQIPEGTAQYTVTALPVDANATVTVNGKAVANGQASAPIISVEARSTIEVLVTAQDGKTTKKYTIKVTDYNLVKKSSNADLSDVKLYYADISPAFKSGTDAYEVYLKPEATGFEITPVKANANAQMKVMVGSKELKGYGGKYNTSLFGNKTTVTVNLTSEDGKSERTYTFDVFKNTKNKEGNFKPITAEMVDYTASDPIVIDISNYAIVDASVFNTLKTEYPTKTIIFAGNDYMLKIKGSDIDELVPHTTQYDLFFSFTTPDEAVIDSMLMSSSSADDWKTKPVYLHFNDHGSLPGQMLLTVSLGGKYKNSTLFWNYYNPERERIDYYGYVQSNAKGTITVPLAHMSTYLVTTRRINVSEDKTGTGFGAFENGNHAGSSSGNISGGISGGKDVPQTGVKADCEGTP